MKNSLLLTLILLPSLVLADTLKPFTTDGCSSFPDGTLEQQSLWVECCIRHDLAYWKGGDYQQRLDADNELQRCVAKVGEPEIAAIMLAGVRVGGSPYFPTSYRWGYGWEFLRGYKALDKNEHDMVKQRLDQFKIMLESLGGELK